MKDVKGEQKQVGPSESVNKESAAAGSKQSSRETLGRIIT
jgi:hypothetical protein